MGEPLAEEEDTPVFNTKCVRCSMLLGREHIPFGCHWEQTGYFRSNIILGRQRVPFGAVYVSAAAQNFIS